MYYEYIFDIKWEWENYYNLVSHDLKAALDIYKPCAKIEMRDPCQIYNILFGPSFECGV